jgi:hypothetical protein
MSSAKLTTFSAGSTTQHQPACHPERSADFGAESKGNAPAVAFAVAVAVAVASTFTAFVFDLSVFDLSVIRGSLLLFFAPLRLCGGFSWRR